MKIKDNLDLQGYLLQNFCVDNYDSLDSISNKGDGRMVFLTGNSTDAKYRHVNVWDGTNFKALAYLEDVAMNADFIALQEKVALLAGDVDTDAIISNMKEVSAFLEGFEEDASLMDLLNSKLSTSGGTMTGNLIMSNGDIVTRECYATADNTYNLGHSDRRWANLYTMLINGGTPIHSGNIGSQSVSYATSAGNAGKLGGYAESSFAKIVIGGSFDTALNFIGYGYKDGGWPSNGNVLAFGHSNLYKTLIHYNYSNSTLNTITYSNGVTGGWKTIAFTDSNVASAQALVHSNGTVGLTVGSLGELCLGSKGIWSKDGTKNLFEYSNNILWLGYSLREDGETKLYGSPVGIYTGNSCRLLINSSGNVTIGASDLAGTSAKLYVDGSTRLGSFTYLNANTYITNASYLFSYAVDGENQKAHNIIGMNANNALLINYGATVNSSQSIIYGDKIQFATGTSSKSTRVTINELGHLLINTTTDNEQGHSLQVQGTSCFGSSVYKKTSSFYRTVITHSSDSLIFGDDQDVSFVRGSEIAFQNKTGGVRSMTMVWNNGDPRIGVGISMPEEKMHIVGNLLVEGNIIATGEVSAGGEGEEGTSGSGAGAFHSESIAVGATQTTIAHGLGTDDIVVSIYEKDATSGLWSMILTDIEITDANNIRVTFGSATTVEHKVVIMGAVA